MKSSCSPAIQILQELRRSTEEIGLTPIPPDASRSEWQKICKARLLSQLAQAKYQLDGLGSSDYSIQNARRLVDWLTKKAESGKNVAGTVHLKLDRTIPLLGQIEDRDLLDVLATSPQQDLILEGRDRERLGKYFGNLRALYKFLSGKKNVPAGLVYHQTKKMQIRSLTLPSEIDELFDWIAQETEGIVQMSNTHIPVSDYLIALILICVYAGLRRMEALQLALSDITITERITLVMIGKMNKPATVEITRDVFDMPDWVLPFLRNIWLRRKVEAGSLAVPFFTGVFFSDANAPSSKSIAGAYQRICRLLEDLDHDDGMHAFRRLFANAARARGVPLNEVSNYLRQTTVKTAPENYLQIYPELQADQLVQWARSQELIKIPAGMSINAFASSLGMTIEGAYKVLERAAADREIERGAHRPKVASLDDVNKIMNLRIRIMQQSPK